MQGELERYNDIIQNQLSQGTVEGADEVVKDERDWYIPQNAVVRQNAESTKMRIVYDASICKCPHSQWFVSDHLRSLQNDGLPVECSLRLHLRKLGFSSSLKEL